MSDRTKLRWCWSCILTGVALFAYAALAFAQQGTGSTVDYATLFQLVAGLLIAMIGTYAKGLSQRIAENKKEIKELGEQLDAHRLTLVRDHHTKHELTEMLHQVVSTLTERITENRAATHAVHRRLDKMNVPSAFPGNEKD